MFKPASSGGEGRSFQKGKGNPHRTGSLNRPYLIMPQPPRPAKEGKKKGLPDGAGYPPGMTQSKERTVTL